ncbi:MAG: helix-turn-helix transcriptional regulator [Lentisphaeria bacterium]|nr:helix-turn-helix transcriptional regulator [Lentisphaeria bacterium]
MLDLPGSVELIGVCYYSPRENMQTIPNIVPPDVFYIEIVLGGEIKYGELNDLRTCRRGMILWHQGGEETIWRSEGKSFTSFAMRFRLLEQWQRPGHFGEWKDLDNLDDFVVDTMQRFFDPNVDKRIFGNYLINRLFWEFYASTIVSSRPDLPLPLAKAMTLLQNEDVATITVAQIARSVQVSAPHLNLLFRKHLDTTPHSYLLQLRLKRARVLLSNTDQPIKNIAEVCGFNCKESFYRVFRAEQGITPAAYRKRNRILQHT